MQLCFIIKTASNKALLGFPFFIRLHEIGMGILFKKTLNVSQGLNDMGQSIQEWTK